MSLVNIVEGIIIGIVVILSIGKARNYSIHRNDGKISWLDYLKIRDMMSHGQTYEAAVFTLKKAYNMSEEEATKLTPEKFHEMMLNLKTEQAKSGM